MTENGRAHHPYSVFKHRDNDSFCVAVADYEAARPIAVEVTFDGSRAPTHWHLVEQSDWQLVPGAITIPRRSAAVVASLGRGV